MSGGSFLHSVIAGNLLAKVHQGLADKPCLALNSDMKVWIAEADKFAYPDLSALCGDIEFYDDSRDEITNLSFLAEVLSPSKELYERGDRSRKYQRLASLQEFLLLSQTEMLAELYLRQDDGTWNLRLLEKLDAILSLSSIECEILLQALYEKVVFETPDQE